MKKTRFQATPSECNSTREWVERFQSEPPFSFSLDGIPSTLWLKGAQCTVEHPEGKREEWVFRYEKDGLAVTVEAAVSRRFPVAEWTVYLENTGDRPTGQIRDFQAIDRVIAPEMTLTHPGINHDVTLTHFKGDYYSPDGFERFNEFFSNGIPFVFENEGGRSTSTRFPYYALASAKQRVMAAVSWQGQWRCQFVIDWKQGVRMTAGLPELDAYLLPGERVRSPLIVLMRLEDPDEARAMNLWRQWMMEDNLPAALGGGDTLPVLNSFGSNARFFEALHATQDNQLFFIDQYIGHNVPFTHWWIDALWYELGKNEVPNWCHVGSWKVDKERFPNGFHPLAKRLRDIDAQVMLWFEPERVTPGTELFEEHRDWLLSVPETEAPDVVQGGLHADRNTSLDNSYLLDLSRTEVVDWLIQRVGDILEENGIGLYRQDFNMSSLRFWRQADPPQRRGITENRYCQGLLRFWDGLLARFPGLLMDTCASGGRRMDLETLRRALPLHKTDFPYGDCRHKAAFHHTLYQWLPFFGSTGITEPPDSLYRFCANFAAFVGMDYDVREAVDYDGINRFLALWKRLHHCLDGDFYSLLPYTRDAREWIAWQFDAPREGDGVVMALAHEDSVYTKARLKPRGIDEDASYTVCVAYDIPQALSGQTVTVSGKDLASGIDLCLEQAPAAAIVYYKKQ